MNRFSLAAILVLITGLSVGAAIYLTAPEPEPGAYIIVGDTAYAYDPAATKTSSTTSTAGSRACGSAGRSASPSPA